MENVTGSMQVPRAQLITAHAFSLLGYPYILIPLSIALTVAASTGEVNDILPLLASLAAVFGVVSVVTWAGVRSGRFSNFDVSTRTERGGFYRLLLVAMVGVSLYLYLTQPHHPALRGLITATVLLAVCSVLNRKLKVSLHAAFAFFAAAFPLAVAPVLSGVLFAFAVAVCWSRLVLKRHVLNEVLVGSALGIVAGASLHLFLK